MHFHEGMMMNFPSSRVLMFGALLAGSMQISCYADERHGSKHNAVPASPLYQQECAACHVAYPPQLLPAASWQALLKNMPHHFGSDATLEPQVVAQLSTWLTANAADAGRMPSRPPEDRISRSTWFVREHHEVPNRIWQLAIVKKGANCTACHTRAAQGDFNERTIRLPQ
jgi:hypothetical protein